MSACTLLAVLAASSMCAQWTPELSMKVKTVTAAVPSPDGKLAVWTETHPVYDGEKSESLTHVYLAHSDGSSRMQLTRGEKSANSPAFSPDGTWVFFASDRSGKRNVYRIAIDGGEAEMLTSIGVHRVWSRCRTPLHCLHPEDRRFATHSPWRGGGFRDFAQREVDRVYGARRRFGRRARQERKTRFPRDR